MAKKDNYIMYNGERLPFSDWITMYDKAQKEGRGKSYYRTRVYRTKNKKTTDPIEFKEIPELGLTLIRR